MISIRATNRPHLDRMRLKLGTRTLEIIATPSVPGSGFISFIELYLDRRYEGYIGIPRQGGPEVIIYGRGPAPEPVNSEPESHADKSQTLSEHESEYRSCISPPPRRYILGQIKKILTGWLHLGT